MYWDTYNNWSLKQVEFKSKNNLFYTYIRPFIAPAQIQIIQIEFIRAKPNSS